MPKVNFELTDLLLRWLDEEYPGKYSCLEEHHTSYYDVITNNYAIMPDIVKNPAKEVLFVGKDKIWLYYSIHGFTIVPAADKVFFEKIKAHIEKYQL